MRNPAGVVVPACALACALAAAGFAPAAYGADPDKAAGPRDGFVLIKGGGFKMGSHENEPWRSPDETPHIVTVSDFYISPYEVSQREYREVTGANPSAFSGDNLPVENVTWLEAAAYCNALSKREGLTPAYTVAGGTVTWDRSADGYRLPTEAEWEYAARAGTQTPFSTETYISPDEADYYGHYPLEIENNYFAQEKLPTKPGVYRQTTVHVYSFAPNAWGLFNVHGNVAEWVWDYYGPYGPSGAADPAGPETGTLRVYRGGGWNDFAKHIRSAYRAVLPQDKASYNLGIRLARNAVPGKGSVTATEKAPPPAGGDKALIAYFSWSGNTRGIAEEIRARTGADLFAIEPEDPYPADYTAVLDRAQRDQHDRARPKLKNRVKDFDRYGTIFLGYPNWWASIPMPVASFLEDYDFAGKTIVPFCSHGGGRLGQTVTAIAKLAPGAALGEPLSVHYSGGSGLGDDIAAWLKKNADAQAAGKAAAAPAAEAAPASGESAAITVNLYYTGKNGGARKFAEEMVASGTAAAIRAEPGNLRYEYFFPMDDPETVLLIDGWRDQRALDAHHASPMMKKITELRDKYDLHMKAERYAPGPEEPSGGAEFIRK